MPYTPRQVSEMLSIPESSLRRLSREFADFLSKQKGRNRKYNESDINTLRRVREMTGHGMTLEQVKTELSLTPESPPEQAAADSLAMVPTIAGELARLDDINRAIVQEIEQLRADRQADRARLEQLEKWFSLPWWKRIFSRPPEPPESPQNRP